MNGLACALFFGKSGNLREKDLQDQLQRASCLNILLNVVVIWNTVYLSRAIEHKRQTTGLDESMLKHISPLNWNHIQLYGKYYFNEASSLENDQYRDLRLLVSRMARFTHRRTDKAEAEDRFLKTSRPRL